MTTHDYYIETQRLTLRKFTLTDASFIVELLNTPTWLAFIGDRNVRTIADAENYLLSGSLKSYQEFGFGFYNVIEKTTDLPVGLCGLTKRETLDEVDIGFAFLPEATNKGFGFESAIAILEYAKTTLHLKKVIAIVNPENFKSQGLLSKIGMKFDRNILLPPENKELLLFSTTWH